MTSGGVDRVRRVLRSEYPGLRRALTVALGDIGSAEEAAREAFVKAWLRIESGTPTADSRLPDCTLPQLPVAGASTSGINLSGPAVESLPGGAALSSVNGNGFALIDLASQYGGAAVGYGFVTIDPALTAAPQSLQYLQGHVDQSTAISAGCALPCTGPWVVHVDVT